MYLIGYMVNLRELNLQLTKQDLKDNMTRDILVIQTIHTIDELIKIINKLVANLRERYGYYAPKVSREEDINKFLDEVSLKNKEDFGMNFQSEDLNSVIELMNEIKNLQGLLDSQEKYLENIMKEVCPRVVNIATPLIGARLIDHAGSLKHLAELPSSTIQVLGAEKALFRHLTTGAKAPKFGVIFAHKLISENKINKGKAARQLASEISKAAKIDYFRKK